MASFDKDQQRREQKKEQRRGHFRQMFQEKMECAPLTVNEICKLSGVSYTGLKYFLKFELKKMSKPQNVLFIGAAIGLTRDEIGEVMFFLGYESRYFFESEEMEGQWKDICELRQRYLKAKKELLKIKELMSKRSKHNYQKNTPFFDG